MASATDVLGDLVVNVGVDASDLSRDFDQVNADAKAAGEEMARFFGEGASDLGAGATDSLKALDDQLASTGTAATGAADQMKLFDEALAIPYADQAGQLNLFATELEPIAGAASSAASGMDSLREAVAAAGIPLDELKDKSSQAAEAEHEVEKGAEGLAEKLLALGEALVITEGLREFGTEALAAYDAVQKAANSLTILTGSAEAAKEVIEGIEHIAAQQPFSFPELADAARRMALVHVEAAKIPAALEAAANAARGTGNSFSSVASSLERITLTGQVTGRQLMQLGLSWGDLAQAAGRSIEYTQALLKKGGQDAMADLELVLRTMEQKFGAFASVPLTIGEQWKVLQNQVHTVFAELGAAMAPILMQIVRFVKEDLTPGVKSLVEAFNSLPGPVKDGVVAFGLVVAAIAPLSLAAGGLALAIEGIKTAATLVTPALQAFGLMSTTTAAEVAAATTAIGEAGLAGAAEHAAVAVGAAGLGGALAGAALVLGTFGGAAAASMAQFNDLRRSYDELAADIKANQIVDALNSGKAIEELKKMAGGMDGLKEALQRTRQEITYSTTSTGELTAGVKAAAAAAKDAKPEFEGFGLTIKVLGDHSKSASEAVLDIVQRHKDLSDAVRTARLAVEELTEKQRTDASVSATLKIAKQDLKTAQDALNSAMGEGKKKIEDTVKAVPEMVKAFMEAADTDQRYLQNLYVAYKELKGAADENPLFSGVATRALKDLNDELARQGKTLADLEPQLATTGTSIGTITGYTHQIKDSSYGWGDSVHYVKTKLDEFGNVIPPTTEEIKKQKDAMDGAALAAKSLAEQFAVISKQAPGALPITLTGHVNELRDAWGYLKDAIQQGEESMKTMGSAAGAGSAALSEHQKMVMADAQANRDLAQAAYEAAAAISAAGAANASFSSTLRKGPGGFGTLTELSQEGRSGTYIRENPAGGGMVGSLGGGPGYEVGWYEAPDPDSGFPGGTYHNQSEASADRDRWARSHQGNARGGSVAGPAAPPAPSSAGAGTNLRLMSDVASINQTISDWKDTSTRAAADNLGAINDLATGRNGTVFRLMSDSLAGIDDEMGGLTSGIKDVAQQVQASSQQIADTLTQTSVGVTHLVDTLATALVPNPTTPVGVSFQPTTQIDTLNITAPSADGRAQAQWVIAELQRHGVRF